MRVRMSNRQNILGTSVLTFLTASTILTRVQWQEFKVLNLPISISLAVPGFLAVPRQREQESAIFLSLNIMGNALIQHKQMSCGQVHNAICQLETNVS